MAYEIARRHQGVRTVLWRGCSLTKGEELFPLYLEEARADRFDGYLLLVDRDTDELASWAMVEGGEARWGIW